ncbi:MAG: ferrous iron transport protein B [Spirochaetes bacterium]|nr:ferrous iron transport protein B [Spirochaetota bacterium]
MNKAVNLKEREMLIAVAGNPNSGKSTLINGIAGSRLHVGNWAGVTVEKNEAILNYQDHKIRLIDLPGCYSLSPYSQEEIIARNFLLNEKPDVIINVVDATNLERNLYLTIQLLELGIPIIIALNIYDEASQKGYSFDIEEMEKLLAAKVIPTVSTSKEGLTNLLDKAIQFYDKGYDRLHKLDYGTDIETALENIVSIVEQKRPDLLTQYPRRWLAFKLLEEDKLFLQKEDITSMKEDLEKMTGHLKKAHSSDMSSFMIDHRYAQAAGLTKAVMKKPAINPRDLTEKIDNVILNRFLGIPIFLIAMWLVFKLTFDLANPFVDWIDFIISGPLSTWATALLTLLRAPDWFHSLIIDGVIAGVGGVLVFLPIIFTMMLFITILEGSGYMARAAFLMDHLMHTIGLHGKSFIPLLLGFGCNVPSIYATRTLEVEKDKVLTSLIVPLMSCSARLPVYMLFTAVFFPKNGGLVIWILYILGILLAFGLGFLFKNTLFKKETPIFIMELPPYRLPSFYSIMIHTWEKVKHFLVKAGTYILALSIIAWFLLNLPWGVEHKRDSWLGKAGTTLAPIFEPLGFGKWQSASALLTGVIAKEAIVSTYGEIYQVHDNATAVKEPLNIGKDILLIGKELIITLKNIGINMLSTFRVVSLEYEATEKEQPVQDIISKEFTPLQAFSFMVFVLLYLPCFVVVVAVKQEFKKWKWPLFIIFYQTLLAWTVSFLVYQGGLLLGFT